MKSPLLFLVFLFINITVFSQVGIGNTNPKAQLDIRSSNQANPSNTDGILIPKADDFPTANPTMDQDGMLLFLTGSGTPSKGFYYWDFAQTSWIPFETNGVKEINDLLDGKSDTNGSSVFLGLNAGANDDGTNNNNTGLGFASLINNITGNRNTAIGYDAVANNTTGTLNSGMGYRVLYNNTTGNYNTAMGTESLFSNINGSYNVASGRNALNSNTSGSYNSALGHNALVSNTVGLMNSSFGDATLYLNQGGSYNSALGKSALYSNVSGTNNTAIGYESGRNAIGSHNIFIGNQAAYNETGSNKLYIENSNANANNALIYGEFDTNLLRVNGRLTLPIITDASGAIGSGVLEIGDALRFDNNEIITNTDATLFLQNDNNGDFRVDSTTLMVDASDNLVGIGNTFPYARLDVRSTSQTGPSNTDGVLIPKANNFPTINPGANQDGMLLFLTGYGTPAKGFYYWNNPITTWVGVGSVKAINDLSDGITYSTSLFLGLNSGIVSSGTDNTAVGYQSLEDNLVGVGNSAFGRGSLNSNTTGNFNSGFGRLTLLDNTTGTQNTAVGHLALISNTIGNNNSALGVNALRNNISAINNTAVGMDALYTNATGDNNVAVGVSALRSNTTGYQNTAMGYATLFNNVDGYNNVAMGFEALTSNTNGDYNNAIGYHALRSNTTGIRNTAIGRQALLYNTTGTDNVSIGGASLYNNTNGTNNVAVGESALYAKTSGYSNTAVGTSALRWLSSGINNIGIGSDAQVPNSTGNNQVRIGNTSITYAGVQVAWTVTSDMRWKDHIRPLPYGLNMLSQLKPVDYIRKNNEHQTREIGFIAQDVKKLLQKLGYDDQGIITEDDKGYMSLRYNDFIPVLVKAVQEQQDIITAQQQELIELKAQVSKYQTLEERIQALEQTATNN